MNARRSQLLNEHLEALASRHGLPNGMEWISTWVDDEHPTLSALAQKCSSQTHILTPLETIKWEKREAALYNLDNGRYFIIQFGMPDSFFYINTQLAGRSEKELEDMVYHANLCQVVDQEMGGFNFDAEVDESWESTFDEFDIEFIRRNGFNTEDLF